MPSRNHKRARAVQGFGFALISLLVVGSLFAYPLALRASEETTVITVVDKERVHSETGSHYRVYTEDEVFKNTDSIWFRKFNSADVQGQLREGQTYTVRVAGWRIRFLSQFRNIISVEDVT